MTIEERRLAVHEKLCRVLNSNHVYFQPPPTVQMIYPAIVYRRESVDRLDANDDVYIHRIRYTVTVINNNPDKTYIQEMFDEFDYVDYDRHYTRDNLNHDVFTIYY